MFWFHTRVRVQPQHSLCGHSHISWNAQAHVTFVCLTEPKMPAAMPKCCSSGLASCPSKKTPLQLTKIFLFFWSSSSFFFSFTFCAIFLNCLDLLSNPIFQWIFHWVCLWSRTWPQGWLKWLQVVVTCFVYYYYYYYCYNFQKWKSHGVPPSFMGL